MSTDANDKILFSCPTCMTKMAVLSIHAGKTVQCRCGVKVVVPLVANRVGTTPNSPVSQPPAATSLPTNNPITLPATNQPSAPSPANPPPANSSTPESPPVEYFTFSCSICNGVLKVRETDRGKACRCRCGVTLTIPTKSVEKQQTAKEATDPLAMDFDFDFDMDAFISSQPQDLPEYLKPPPPNPPQRPY